MTEYEGSEGHRAVTRLHLGMLVLVAILSACGPASASPTNPPAVTSTPSFSAPPQASPTPTAVDAASIPDRSVKPISIELPAAASRGRVVATRDAMWVSFDAGLWQVDPKSNRVTKTVTLGRLTDFLAFGFDSLWADNYDAATVSRIDPANGHTIATIKVADPQGIVVTDQGVWVASHHSGAVALIDPKINQGGAGVVVGPSGSSGPLTMTVSDGKVWVGVPNASQVVEFDPANRAVVTTVANVGSPCGDMATSAGDLWVSECREQPEVDEIGLDSGTLVHSTSVDGFVGTPIPVADGVWLPLSSPTRLLKVSDATGQPVDAIGLPSECSSQDLDDAAVAFGSIWILCPQSLLRFAPSDLP